MNGRYSFWNTRWCVLVIGGLVLLVSTGCTETELAESSEETSYTVLEQLNDVQELQRKRAIEAKDALFGSLVQELTNTMQAEGPVKAITVCKDRASEIATDVSREQGLRIGRTSFKLRNPINEPPAWVAKLPPAAEFNCGSKGCESS